MRGAHSRPGHARQDSEERLRRDRAAARSLRAAYPTIGQLRLELKFEAAGASAPALQLHILHPAAPAFFQFSCPHADCSGQFDLTAAVNDALADGARRFSQGLLECGGIRPRDHITKKPCELKLLYTISASSHASRESV